MPGARGDAVDRRPTIGFSSRRMREDQGVVGAAQDRRQGRGIRGRRLAQVLAGAERGAGAGEDERADGAVPARRADRRQELALEGGVERVARLGPVERDRRHRVLDLVPQRGVPRSPAISGPSSGAVASRRTPPCPPSGRPWRTGRRTPAAPSARPCGQRRVVGLVDRPLRRRHGERRHRRDLRGERERLLEGRLRGHDPRDQAEPLGLARVERASGQDQLHRPRLADRAGQPLRAARAGHHPDPDLGLAELRVLAGDDHVAGHRELAAAAEGEPAHRGDQRLADRAQLRPSARTRRRVASDSGVASAISLMSAPAAKARSPAPVMTIARTRPRRRGPASASTAARAASKLSALRASGAMSVTSATPGDLALRAERAGRRGPAAPRGAAGAAGGAGVGRVPSTAAWSRGPGWRRVVRQVAAPTASRGTAARRTPRP